MDKSLNCPGVPKVARSLFVGLLIQSIEEEGLVMTGTNSMHQCLQTRSSDEITDRETFQNNARIGIALSELGSARSGCAACCLGAGAVVAVVAVHHRVALQLAHNEKSLPGVPEVAPALGPKAAEPREGLTILTHTRVAPRTGTGTELTPPWPLGGVDGVRVQALKATNAFFQRQ
jgi:hypothetical protein